MVSYTYDAWGKKISTSGMLASTLGMLNPFRYRGYVYDEETSLYYLNSRYYNPDQVRFCNKDEQVHHSMFGCNLFTYCGNNPVMYNDPDGHDWVSGLTNGVSNVIDFFFPGSSQRAKKVLSPNRTAYDVVNWLTMGLADSAKGAFAPENPLSLQHWIDSATVVTLGFSAYRFASFRGGFRSNGIVTFPPKPALHFPTDANRIHHIMQPHHNWGKVGATTWEGIQAIIEYTVNNGTFGPYKNGNLLYTASYGYETIEVSVRYINDVLTVVDAWVKR